MSLSFSPEDEGSGGGGGGETVCLPSNGLNSEVCLLRAAIPLLKVTNESGRKEKERRRGEREERRKGGKEKVR